MPNDNRFQMTDSGTEFSLTIVDILLPDVGIYECVAKNAVGEARCKARLNVNLSKTGESVEIGPKLIAPRFATSIKPIIGQEGSNTEFRVNYIGNPGKKNNIYFLKLF